MGNYSVTIENLLEKTSEILQKYENKKTSGEKFNVLDICRVRTIETNHTEIIAELLRPTGTHGFGINSLKAFFRQANLEILADCCDGCDVQTEVEIPGRSLDILIRNENLCVVIENKTNTTDHYMQLADYRKWLQKPNAEHKYLLYLTYNGSDATDESIKPGEYNKISYKKNICNWLYECACLNNQIASIFCKQYANYITDFILGNINMQIDNEIKKIINSTEKMIAAEKIANIVANLKTEKYLELFNTWAKINEKEVLVSLTSAQCSDCIKINCKDENLVIGFSFDSSNFRNFYYGLTWKDGKERDINYIEKHYPKQKDWGQAAWWPYWKYFNKEYLHPGDNLDFLFDDKEKLYEAMNDAFKKMNKLLSIISKK